MTHSPQAAPEAKRDPEPGASAVPLRTDAATVTHGSPPAQPVPNVDQARSGDDTTPPRVTSAQLSGGDVRLFFSEPLAPVRDLDPRQFRLSVAVSYTDGDDSSGYYYDVGYLNRSVTVEGLQANPDDDAELTLELNRPIRAELCEHIRDLQADPELQAGLFVHYTRHGGAEVTDRAGNALREVGSDWALRVGDQVVALDGKGVVMRTDLLIPVPCAVERAI